MFTSDQVSALRALIRIWSVNRFVLIGASALRWHMGDRSRTTHDIDLILGISLERYPAGLENEPGWSRHPKREHTWIAPGDVYVDVIPVGAGSGESNVLTWPESGSQMSLAGLRLALDEAAAIEVAPGLTIQVAPLEVIALLKMVSYMDRPHERDRDLEDIALILDEYVSATDDRRYGNDILDLALRYEEISPFLLGRRLAAIVNQPERDAANEFIDLVKGANDATATQARMVANAPPSWHKDPEALLVRIAAFERGFSGAADGEE